MIISIRFRMFEAYAHSTSLTFIYFGLVFHLDSLDILSAIQGRQSIQSHSFFNAIFRIHFLEVKKAQPHRAHLILSWVWLI